MSIYGGFRPIRHVTGAPYNGQANRYEHPAADGTALFVGDIVKLDSAAADTVDGTPAVIAATAGDVPIGVIVGIDPVLTNLASLNVAASTKQYVYVCDDPGIVMAVASSGTLAASDMAKTANLLASTAGSTTLGLSGMLLNEADVGTSTHTFLLERLYLDNTNALGASGVVEVSFNAHAKKSTPGV